MLVHPVWRAPLSAATRRPLLAARYSQANGAVIDLVGDLTDSNPPAPGPQGYPPPIGDPFRKKEISKFIEPKPAYRLHCHSTSNNTITTLTLPTGHPIAWFSGGSCGFKKGNRASYEAGYQCAVRMFKKIEEIQAKQPIELDLFFKGFGQGRDALHKALMTSEGEVVRPLVSTITDRTAIKIGGTRAKKTRRL